MIQRKIFLSRFVSIFLLSGLLLILSACSKNTEEAVSQNDDFTLTLLTSPWPPDAINYLAQEKGFFKENGVNVKLLWAEGYEETFDMVESGELNIWNTTLLDAVAYYANEGGGQVILVEDYSQGADAVVSMSDIKSVASLKGKTVGVEKGTVGEFFLKILLEREGLILPDVTTIDVASEAILENLKNGKIAAGVCYEPCPNDVIQAGGKVIVDSGKERDLIVDVYVGKKDHIEEHKEAYIKVLKAIVEAQDYFNAHPEESAEIMQKVLNMPKEEIIATFKNLRIPTFEENQTAFNRASGFSSLDNLVKLASQYLEEQELTNGDLNTNDVINSELVTTVAENDDNTN